jgi:hypothetical protein
MAQRLPLLSVEGLQNLSTGLSTKPKEKEESPMEAQAIKTERSRRKRAIGKVGICAACTNLAVCRYPKSIQNPVMFCEEFSTVRRNPRRSANVLEPVLVEAPPQIAVNQEKFSNNYIGLCKHCDKLYACRLTKPGGGTWLCEFFEERKAAK